MKIIKANQHPESLGRIVSLARSENWRDPFLHLHDLDYFVCTVSSPWEDYSVVILDDKDEPLGLALANSSGGDLKYFSQPIVFLHPDGLSVLQRDSARQTMTGVLLQQLGDSNLKQLEIASAPGEDNGELSLWQLVMANAGGKFMPRFYGVIDLKQDPETVWRDVRKSYRPLINKGRKLLRIQIMDQSNVDEALFDDFRKFHQRISGRATRSKKSWNAMLDQLRIGEAELVSGWLEDKLVATTFISHNPITAIYAAGVYERSLFKMPLAHATLWTAIDSMQKKGLEVFLLGEVYLPSGASAKEHNITRFKKGFTSRILTAGYWCVAAKNAE